ncbi:glycosyltransferase family 4 protein [Acinetobacter sp. TSRC1-2]|uniref:glycosyltransferase family 4 protein n=1 Tax=unclassified Acinetobacter TaxID=196816 RepID=UPI003CF9AA2B
MNTNRTIWIINQYSSTPETGIAGRSYYLSDELSKLGFKVYLIAASNHHLLRLPKLLDSEYLIENINDNFSFVWVNTLKYEEAHSKKRVLNWFRFSHKVKKISSFIKEKPDVILFSSPSPIGSLGATYLSKYFKVPFIFEVRDIWPLTLVELGGYSENHPFIRFMQWIEDRAYKKSKYVFSNLFNAVEHLKSRGFSSEKFHWIPNGISLAEVSDKEDLEIDILEKIPKNKFIIGYTGTLGVANAMDDLIEAANIIPINNNIHFVIVGSGKEKEILIRQAKSLNLDNITFIDSIPKKQIQSILALFDICYIGWKKNSLYRFGIAPNKLPEYLYSKKPIIHAFSGKGDLVTQANAGIIVEAENPKAIAEGIMNIYNLTNTQREKLGENGQNFVIENLTYKKIAKKIVNIIE